MIIAMTWKVHKSTSVGSGRFSICEERGSKFKTLYVGLGKTNVEKELQIANIIKVNIKIITQKIPTL